MESKSNRKKKLFDSSIQTIRSCRACFYHLNSSIASLVLYEFAEAMVNCKLIEKCLALWAELLVEKYFAIVDYKLSDKNSVCNLARKSSLFNLSNHLR